VSNVLSEEKKQQIIALGRLGWPLRRIQKETGVRRETAAAYLKAAGLAVRPPGAWGRRPPSKPANEVTPDFGAASEASHSPTASACEPYRDFIELSLGKGRNAKAIYQDLVDDHGLRASYQSVKRFVGKLRGSAAAEACSVIVTPPGEELQVDYGTGPMVRDPHTGRYRRTRMFVLTLGFSRKAVHLLAFTSSTQTWVELHQQALRRLGGATRTVVLDNLREGVLQPDIYDPSLNPLYRDMLAHYGAVALPCRTGDPDRKGKVERSVGHAKNTPLKGLRFESLDEAQSYLDRWERNWAVGDHLKT
jgi:transposase